MGFYDEVDGLGIVEDHIQGVLNLEQDESLKLMGKYGEIRKELRDRLDRVRSDSFTAQHLRGVMAQVEGAIEAMNQHIGGEIKFSAKEAALQGIDDLVSEITTFDKEFKGSVTPINLNSALLATDTANFLVSKYQTNLDKYGQDLLTHISNGLFSASIGEASYGQVVNRIGGYFQAEEWKLHRVVRTELHNIYNMGKVRGMRELVDNDTMPDLQKTLMHPMDGRTGKDSMYAATLGLVVPVEQPFEYIWQGKRRLFMAPPDRPNDRAILVPYTPEWGEPSDDAFVPM